MTRRTPRPSRRLALWPALLLAAAPAAGDDPFTPHLDGRPPDLVRTLAPPDQVPPGVTVRRVVFRSRHDSEIYAVLAAPAAPGPHPGLLVLHGGGGCAEEKKAIAWARRGYVAVAPDLPGIADPGKLAHTRGPWSAFKYGEGRWSATPDASSSVLFDATLAAMKSLYLLRAQPDVDPARIGVVGISWGGYMTTLVCALAGDQVRAGFSVFGCGFYDLTSQAHGPRSPLAKLTEPERDRWLAQLDPGRRAGNLRATFFIAGAANDFFYWPRAVQATLDAIPGEKNHVFAPNANHKIPLPGGTEFPAARPDPAFTPTAFQPFPTPAGNDANWLAMEVPYFDHHLKGAGAPLPRVRVLPSPSPRVVRFEVDSPRPVQRAEVFWARAHPDVATREWIAAPATPGDAHRYESRLPDDAADWFAVVSDDRPVTVSGNLTHLPDPARP